MEQGSKLLPLDLQERGVEIMVIYMELRGRHEMVNENPLTAYMIPENWEHMSGIKMYTGSDYVGRVWGNEEEGYLWNARRGEKGWNRSGREAVSIMRCLYWSQRRRFELQQKRAE